MMQRGSFKMPIVDRRRMADYRRNRYSSDPEYRLARVNANRARCGLPPLRSVDEIRTKSEIAQDAARDRQRRRDGRFA